MTYQKGQKGYWAGKKRSIPQETRDKISNTLMGHPISDKVRMTLREKSPFKKGFTPWNKGKPWSEEMKKRISDTNKRKGIKPKKNFVGFGTGHPRWKGGKENDRLVNKRRRALSKGADGSHTEGEWETLKAQYNWTCPRCKRREPEIKLTEDHIVPLSKGGSHNIENIQPLCHSCNCSKGNRVSIKYEH